MARPAGGRAVLAQAKAVLETARNVDELKMAQAVVLPLELGLILRQTAAAIGVSPGWVCRLRNRFERIIQGEESPNQTRGGRRREFLTPEQEDALEDHLEHALWDLENDPARVYSITAWSWIVNAL